MFGLQKKGTNFFGTGSRQSTKSRSSTARRVAASRSKKSSESAAPRLRNAHSKIRSKTKNSLGIGISKSHQTSSRSGKAKVVKMHCPSSQSKNSKKGSHLRSNSQKRDVSKSVLSRPRGFGSKPRSHSKQQKQPDYVFTSDDAERGANGKLINSSRYQKFVMMCTKLGVFVTMLGQLGFIIYIFVLDVLRDEIPTSTGLVLSLTHLMIIFLSLEVIVYATKTLCLFTCLADLLAILASFIYIAIRESSNNYLGENLTVTQSARALHRAIFATAESCVLLMFNLCMVLILYTETRLTSSTEIGVAVMSMDLEGADQERERRADLEKAGLTQKVGAFVPFLQMIRRKKADPKVGALGDGHVTPLERQGKMATLAPMKAPQQTPQRAATDRSSAFSKTGKSSASTTTAQFTPGKEIPATVPASVLPGSEKSTTSQKPSPPKWTLSATSSKQKPEKPRILAQNVPIAASLDMAVPPQTTVSAMITPEGPLGSVQTVKLANETPEVVTATPQQATNTPENMVTPAADPSRVAAASARPPSSASSATLMRYLYEEKQKANQ